MFDTCSIQGQGHNRETLINFEPTSYHHMYASDRILLNNVVVSSEND